MKFKKSLSVIISGAVAMGAAAAATQLISAEGAATPSVTLQEFWGDLYNIEAAPATDFTYRFDDELGGVVITEYNGTAADVKVPDSIDGQPVVEIDFSKSTKIIESLILPDTIENVDLMRYDDIINTLKMTKAPTSGFTFYTDEELGGVVITNYNSSASILRLPDTIETSTGAMNVVGVDFSECTTDIDMVVLPEKAEFLALGDYAARTVKMSELNAIKLDGEYNGISVSKMNIPVKCLDNRYAFSGSALRSVYVPAEAAKIPDWTFGKCEWLTDVVIAGDNVEIGNYAFSCCEELNNIDISVANKIGDWAFGSCASLEKAALADDLTYIGEGAFSSCENLTTVSVSANVNYIGDYAFDGCEMLMAINVNEGNAKYTSVDGVLFNKKMTVLMKMPENNMITDYVVPTGVKEIDTAAFRNSSIKTITIPSGVNYIGYEAFVDSKLSYIGLPRSVSVVEPNAFGSISVGTNRYTSGSGDIYNGINTSLF